MSSTGLRILATVAASALALVLVAPLAFMAVMMLAGPHGGMLPRPWHGAALLAGWALVFAIPWFAGRWVWRHWGRAPDAD